MKQDNYDVCVIGAGVTGASIARELARYQLNILVLEREADICWGTSKANSGVVHAGYAATPGSLKAKFNVLGTEMLPQLCKELVVPFRQNGTFVVALEDDDTSEIDKLKRQGDQNGVPTELLTDKQQILEMEPSLSPQVEQVLFAPTGGIVSPYELTIALAENAYTNGVTFKFNSPVETIEQNKNYFILNAGGETFNAQVVVNAAGLYSDKIASMVGLADFTIRPRRGEYVLFEKDSLKINRVMFPIPTKHSKGILASTTLEGHPFIGPNSIETDRREDLDTYKEGLEEVVSGAKRLLPDLPLRKSIRTFAGLRAVAQPMNDFLLGETRVSGFINAAGIQSPGLSAAPAIGDHIARLVGRILDARPNKSFDPIRHNPPVKFSHLTDEEKDRLIGTDPNYAHVICRCELVTKAEVLDAIHRPLGATTLDGIKFRTRTRMGRCQGSFCTFRLMDLLEKELALEPEEITLKGSGSQIVVGATKDLRLKKEV